MKNLTKEVLDNCEELSACVFLMECAVETVAKNGILPDMAKVGLNRLMDRIHDINGEITEDLIELSEL